MAHSERGSLRKGAWSVEEDILLRKCIEKYGEGNWHLVPLKAGLRRCRKSCRLRWLNYLRPSIKRGSFEADEMDLIVRLHKLLGNRWSLIAGRIPGRTANDIKNFWNSHLRKKQVSPTEKNENVNSCSVIRTKVIQPRPVIPSPNSKWFRELRESTETQKVTIRLPPSPSPPPPILWEKNPDEWWKDMLSRENNNTSNTLSTEVYGEDATVVTSKSDAKQGLDEIHEDAIIPIDEWSDVVMGDDIWNIFEYNVWTS